MKLVHISDIHCSKGWMFNSNILEKAIKEINKISPVIVVITGDLTDWGLRFEFEMAKNWLKELKSEYIVVSGNHDARTEGHRTFEKVFSKHRRYFSKMVDDVHFIGIDSSEPDIDEGHVGREQLEWMGCELKEEETQIVFMHHHLVPVPNTGRERNVLVDAGDMLQLLLQNNISLVLSGHRHIPWIWSLNNLIICHAGTLSCERTPYDNSFNIVEIKDGKIKIELFNVKKGKKSLLKG